MNNLHGVNVLSCFDGFSGGQIALERAGIKVNNYFASEIDKYAMKVTMAHYPQTVQLGTIENWKSWDLPKIDLLIGGSPCQGFSNAGLGLNFDDPRSKLFFTYVDILKDLREKNPDLQFLLENVKMKKEWQKIITGYMGVEPVLINSALVSAQNRQRLYWANWQIEQPEDKHIYLKDIIEDEVEEKYLGGYNPSYKTQSNSAHDVEGKFPAICAGTHGYALGYIKFGAKFNRKDGLGEEIDKSLPVLSSDWRGLNRNQNQTAIVQGAAIRNQVTKRGTEEQLNVRKDEKSNCVVPSYPHKLNGLVFVGGLGDKDWAKDGKKLSRNYPQGRRVYSAEGKATALTSQGVGSIGGATGIYEIKKSELIQVGMADDIKGHDVVRRIYSPDGKSPTLTNMQGGHRQPKIATDEYTYRKLTPVECEKLQTVEPGWTDMLSNTQRYKCLGNGWTIDVIAHILNSNQRLIQI